MEEKEKSERFNQGKPKWSLVHFESLIPMVRVLEYGAIKYSPDNWKKGLDKKRNIGKFKQTFICINGWRGK